MWLALCKPDFLRIAVELKEIKGVGDKTLVKLNEIGIFSVTDLINNLPRSYCDMTNVSSPKDIVEGEHMLLKVKILKVYPKQYSKNKLCYIKCDTICEDLEISLIWFNMPYMEYSLACGDYLVWGVIKYENKKYTMVNPNFADINNKYKLKDVQPIYSLKGKIGEVSYRKILENAILNADIENLLPQYFDLKDIFYKIHFAKSAIEMENAQEQLATYELAVQLLCYKMLRKLKKCNPMKVQYPHFVDTLLPYKLTESQVHALQEIVADLQSGLQMNRFVLGDVGSGKTIVAHLAMYMVCCEGGQSALLAPTEILARQHFENFKKVFGKFGIKIALLTSQIAKEEKKEILERLANGEIDMLFATHSCVEDNVKFYNLQLVVIDEAHKFGVKQKSSLLAKGECVHCISMSATPLPRSFAMMVFGDLKISKLYKTESRKSNIKTYALRSNKIEDMFKYFSEKCQKGSQIIIVCPHVNDNDTEDLYSVKSVYKMLSGKVIAKEDIGLLYGSMKNADKEKVISNFYSGKIKVLVSTTVIEVGIDIPAVDTIAILGADRFGIATLHQLRGRVGRDGRQAECYLHCMSYTIPDRILQMKEISDGVVLSELDSKARGYGDFIGFNQSGKNSYSKYVIKITLDMIDSAKNIVCSVDTNSLDQKLLKKMMHKYNFYQDIVLN